MSGSWADDRSGARSVFSRFECPMAHKVFANISYCSVQHLTMQGELLQICHPFLLILSDPLPPDSPARQTRHQHPRLHSLPSCSTGTHRNNLLPPVSKGQPSRAPDTLSFGEGGRKISLQIREENSASSPKFSFSPHSFKCQTPTQFL